MNIAIIPARGGSKRIHKKNIRDFCGKPIIAYSIAAARESGLFKQIIVSTDDAEIAAVARDWGAEIPFMRPLALADDHTATVPVIAHAVEQMQQQGGGLDMACCIYATAPFLQAEDLIRGYQQINAERAAHYAFSVTRYDFPLQRAIRMLASGGVEPVFPEYRDYRSQDLEPLFHDAGQFYWGRPSAWLTGQPFFSAQSLAVTIPSYRVQDIDSEEDWLRAEAMWKANA